MHLLNECDSCERERDICMRNLGKIRADAFVDIVIILIVNLFISVINFTSRIDTFYIILAFFSIAVTAMTIRYEYKTDGSIFNFATIFLALSFIFTFGQVILLAVFVFTGNTGYRIVIDYYGKVKTIYALKIIFMVYSSLCIGIILASKNVRNIKFIAQNAFSTDEIARAYQDQKYAKRIILLTFPIRVLTDLMILFAGMSGGFSSSGLMTSSFPDIIISYGNFSIIGLALLVFSLRINKKKQTLTFFSIAAYFCLMMLNGRRSETVVYLCVIGLIYVSTNKKIKAGKLLQYCLLAYIFLAGLYSVVLMRTYHETYSVAVFLECLLDSLTTRNIIFEVLREYGNTCYTPISVIVNWLPTYGPTWGTSYYMGVSAILINLFGIQGRLTRQSCFGLTLQNTTGMLSPYYVNIGGSIYGEWLFNFGIVGAVLIGIFIGVLIGKLSRNANVVMRLSDGKKLAYFVPLMTSILYWIRDYFSGGIRELVWGILFVYITSRILSSRRGSSNDKIRHMEKRL